MKPIFALLVWLYAQIGNFGVSIICLTLIVRTLLFPIAQRQFASMAAVRAIQPKMKAIQERYADDRMTMQQEVMKLYKEEKVNPAAGCLPIFLQIPVFYALYKVLMVSVEMRHKPFVLWIQDLSAPDPLTPVNLFGYLDFTRPYFLAIGVLPILLGITMWLQMRLQSANARSGAAADLRLDALGADVRDGEFRRRPAALLGDRRHPNHRPAEVALQPPPQLKTAEAAAAAAAPTPPPPRSERGDGAGGSGAEALFRAGRLPQIGARAPLPARSERPGDRLRRPLERRQILAAQPADQPQQPGADLEHAGRTQ